jgi:predicted DNA-binding transcriptional regulator AlpA
MPQTDNLDSWLPMNEVVARTGMSQRTVYRMVTEGRLKQAQRRMPGRRPLSVFDPRAVAQIAASTLRPDVIRQQNATPSATQNEDPDVVSGTLLPPSELSFKLYLTEEEAVRYTGFGRAHLRACGKGKMIGPHGARVYRRVDLEKL